MKSAVETLSPTRVRLSVEVPFAELETSVRKAYKTISQHVTVPGFRPGKVPFRLIDQRVGRAAVLEEAAQEAIPQQYLAAVREHEVKAIGRPDVEITKLEDGQLLAFTAEVDVRPDITLPDLSSLKVTVDPLPVSDEDIDEQLSTLRDRFATLKGVERPAQVGDHVSIDLAAAVDGEEVEGGSASGVSYEVGTNRMLEGLDEALTGMSAGEAGTFTTSLVGGEHAGKDAVVSVTVRTVREKELPELNDEFAQLASEFDTLEELRADSRKRLEQARRFEQAYQARDRAVEALIGATEVPVPDGVVTEEVEFRKQSMRQQLEQMGASLDVYLSAEDKTEAQLDEELNGSARDAVKTQLVLDALADAEELGVTDQELTTEVVRRAQSSGVPPQQYADQLTRGGQLGALVSDVRRSKALAVVMEQVKLVDPDGEPVDLSDVLRPAQPAADDPEPAGE